MKFISYLYVFFFFFFNDTATTEIYTLSLHDALPISRFGRSEKSTSPWFQPGWGAFGLRVRSGNPRTEPMSVNSFGEHESGPASPSVRLQSGQDSSPVSSGTRDTIAHQALCPTTRPENFLRGTSTS